jgi:hypothetical protein
MDSILTRRIGPMTSVVGALTLLVASAMAQPGPATPTPTTKPRRAVDRGGEVRPNDHMEVERQIVGR